MSAIQRSETDVTSVVTSVASVGVERSAEQLSAAEKAAERVLAEWTVHLYRREPQRVMVVFSAMLFCASVGWMLFHSPLFSFAAVLMVLGATSEYLFPIRYRLTDRRAQASYGAARFEIPWTGVKRVLEGPEALKLSPLRAASRLDATRGVLLRFAPEGEPGDRESILRTVQEQVEAARSKEAVPGDA